MKCDVASTAATNLMLPSYIKTCFKTSQLYTSYNTMVRKGYNKYAMDVLDGTDWIG